MPLQRPIAADGRRLHEPDAGRRDGYPRAPVGEVGLRVAGRRRGHADDFVLTGGILRPVAVLVPADEMKTIPLSRICSAITSWRTSDSTSMPKLRLTTLAPLSTAISTPRAMSIALHAVAVKDADRQDPRIRRNREDEAGHERPMPDGFIDEIVFVAVYPVRQVGRIIVPVDEIDRSGRNPPGELRVAGVDSRIQDGHDDAPPRLRVHAADARMRPIAC